MKLVVPKRDLQTGVLEPMNPFLGQTGAKVEFCCNSIFGRAVKQRFTFFVETLDSLLGMETKGIRPIGIQPEVESICSCGRLACVSGVLVLCLGALFFSYWMDRFLIMGN